MKRPAADARHEILQRLRRSPQSPGSLSGSEGDPAVGHAVPMTVTHAEGDRRTLARQFGSKLEQLAGSYEIVDRTAEVPQRLLQRIAEWNSEREPSSTETADSSTLKVLSWAADELSVPGLEEQLRRSGLSLVVPDDLHEAGCRARAASTSVGLTAVDAAFASTGSVLLASGPGRNRSASLLPARHFLLVPMSRIHPTFEAWLQSLRGQARLEPLLRQSGQIVFVTGPSRSADIELRLTLGVHGPGAVHAIIFDDER
jgi:L-lactate dehydrogenase complex protein LldG